MSVIQRNIRKWLGLKDWGWWRLYTRVKPMLSMAHAEDEMKIKEDEYKKNKEELEKIAQIKRELEEQNITLTQVKNDIFLELQAEQVGYQAIDWYSKCLHATYVNIANLYSIIL